MPTERILITVKTYPTLSRTYGETVCTAGIRQDGSWVRMYPVPFRRLDEEQQYRKFDWVECKLEKNLKDPRPETHRPVAINDMRAVGHVGTGNNWRERRDHLLRHSKVHTNLTELISEAKSNTASLAIFRPTGVEAFLHEAEDPEWDPKQLQQMRTFHSQLDLFEESDWRKNFAIIPKLPFSFSYRFRDVAGRQSTLQILDWEIGALYWNCLRDAAGDPEIAVQKVRQKYFDEFLKTDLHFFLGTTQQYHFVAPNPWVIIGVLPIPHEPQGNLLDGL